MLGHKTPLAMLATDLNCQPNECISTSDQDLAAAHEHTHILCADSQIASGTTGACKCSGEEATTTTTTTSSALSLRISGSTSVYSVFLVGLALLL